MNEAKLDLTCGADIEGDRFRDKSSITRRVFEPFAATSDLALRRTIFGAHSPKLLSQHLRLSTRRQVSTVRQNAEINGDNVRGPIRGSDDL